MGYTGVGIKLAKITKECQGTEDHALGVFEQDKKRGDKGQGTRMCRTFYVSSRETPFNQYKGPKIVRSKATTSYWIDVDNVQYPRTQT